MTDKINIDQKVISELDKTQVIYKTSMLGSFFIFMNLVVVIAVLYVLGFSKFNIFQQNKLINDQQNQIIKLQSQNKDLTNKLNVVSNEQQYVSRKLASINVSQTDLLLSQVTSLINGANQSIVVYHDNVGAVQLLKSAEQVLSTTNDPIFSNLKIALTSDLDNLLTLNNSDNMLIQSQIGVLSSTVANLKFNSIRTVSANKVTNSYWQKFINNIRQSIVGLIEIKEINPEFKDQLNLPDDSNLLNQRLKLNILNLQQAILLNNSSEWLLNLDQIDYIVIHYYLNDFNAQKVITITNEMRQINFTTNNANLDKTINALSKSIQLHSGK